MVEVAEASLEESGDYCFECECGYVFSEGFVHCASCGTLHGVFEAESTGECEWCGEGISKFCCPECDSEATIVGKIYWVCASCGCLFGENNLVGK